MKTILKISFILLFPLMSFSQGVGRFSDKFGPNVTEYNDNVSDIKNKKVMEYPYVRESDVYWSKVTWEVIDLREKFNLPLYYPTVASKETNQGRRSFMNAVLDGISDNLIYAYKVGNKVHEPNFEYGNDYISLDEVMNITYSVDDPYEDENGVMIYDTTTWQPDEVKQILVKEVWYFNRKESSLHCEIIGLCPIRITEKGSEPLFWLYYPDIRQYLANIPVYNPDNDQPLYSYDDLFVHRYFRSYFVRESNVYDNREITEYLSGEEALMESERIKKEIFDFEQDLWEN